MDIFTVAIVALVCAAVVDVAETLSNLFATRKQVEERPPAGK